MNKLQSLLIGLEAVALTAQAAPFPLTGKVVDAEGQPVSGAVVERYEYSRLPAAAGGMEMRERTTTDANGGFEFSATRTRIELLARKPGLAPAWQQFMATPGAKPRLTLVPPTVLAGVVLDEADQPVAGAQVSVAMAYSETTQEGGGQAFHYLSGNLAQECFNARTSADGRFRISGFPTNANAELTVLASGKARKPSDEPEYIGPDTMSFRAGQEDIRLVVEPAGSIEGKIVPEPGGPPLPRSRLFLQPDRPRTYAPTQGEPAESEADGSFRVRDVPAGSYRLHVTFGTNVVPDWVAESVPVSVESGEATRGVEIAAMRGSLLEVAVLDKPERKPRAEVQVSAYRAAFRAAARSASNGVAWLRLPPGAFRVSASAEGWRSEDTVATMEAGKTNRVEIELTPPPKITGVIRRPDGQPAAGLAVQIVGGFSADDSQNKTDANGRFEAEWDPRRYGGMERTFCLLIRDAERNLAVAEDIDEETGPLDLRLTPGLTLAGRAECDGKPVTNVTAALVFWAGNSGMHLAGLNIATNTPGRFEIPALPPGRRYGVIVSAPGYGQKSLHDFEVSADAGRQELDPVELKPANLQLAGHVLDANDKPVAGANVQIYGDDQPTGSARTDREGRFRFAQVCEGPAQLHANARSSYGNVTAEGGETNVVLRLGENASVQVDATPRRLKGTVTDPDGKPVVGARVSVFPSDSSRWTKTGTNGAFDIKWSLQPWQVQSGGNPTLVVLDALHDLAAAEDIEEDATNLNVQLKPALTLTGRVEGPAGQALTDAEVGFWLRVGNTSSQVNEQPTHADTKGRFEIKTLPAGAQYTVFAKAKGHGRSQQELEAGSETNRIELEPFVLKVADRIVAGQVLNEKDKPLSGVHVNLSGEDQPDGSTTTDRDGRFSFKVCEGTVQLFASGQTGGYANVTAEAGDTNVVLQLGRNQPGVQPAARSSSLKGKALPDLGALGLAADAAPSGKPVLLCLLDVEQRPSRRMARLLAEQHDALRQKGLTVLAAQVTVTGADAFKEWQATSPVPFPVGRVSEKSEKVKWATAQESLPWLILTDAAGRVVAEGFALDELDAKLKP